MRVGLVLAGGAVKGAYQVGALRALEKFFSPEEISVVCSASIGVINSYSFVTNRLPYAEATWRNINAVSKSVLVTQLLNSDYLLNVFSELSEKKIETEHFIVPLLNLRKRTLEYHNLSEVTQRDTMKRILRASVAIPPVCKAVKVGESHYLDGAVVEAIPIKEMEKYNLDYIICIYFDKATPVFSKTGISNRVVKICFDDETRLANGTCLTKKNTHKMITKGELQTKRILNFVFRNGKDNLPAIMEAIEHLDHLQSGGPKKMITTSRGLGVLNSITKTFIKH
ncbi:MAG: patatin-like phospholipase family protein [Clostridia bacterium]|nr:patatin-like phospholipase family protein [Clostridia bacterium]MBR2927020.1 patatin-like phospholipase family protein [Clostridia bacterium]